MEFYNLKIRFSFYLTLILLLSIKPLAVNFSNIKLSINNLDIKSHLFKSDLTYIDDIKNSIRISYVGDLILLKDQVIAAKNNLTGKYEFDEMFKFI